MARSLFHQRCIVSEVACRCVYCPEYYHYLTQNPTIDELIAPAATAIYFRMTRGHDSNDVKNNNPVRHEVGIRMAY